MIDPKTGLPVPVEFPEVIRTNRIKELNVDNLTFSETANCLRKAFPEVNFVIAESIRKQQEQFGLPIRLDLRLRNAALRDILNSISYATDGKILWHLVGENIVVFELRPDLIAATSAMHPPSNPVRSVQVFNLSQILRGLDKMECEKVLEDVNKLTYNTLERLHDGENISSQMPRCNYHPETGVLILIGPDSANKLFFDILRNVDASRRAPAKDPSAGKTEALENPAVSSKPAVPSSPK